MTEQLSTAQHMVAQCSASDNASLTFLVNQKTYTVSIIHCLTWLLGFPGGSVVKNLPRCEFDPFLGQEDPLEKEIATNSSILARRIPWKDEPGELVHGVTKSQI